MNCGVVWYFRSAWLIRSSTSANGIPATFTVRYAGCRIVLSAATMNSPLISSRPTTRIRT